MNKLQVSPSTRNSYEQSPNTRSLNPMPNNNDNFNQALINAKPLVLAVIHRTGIKDRATCEDIAQDAFIKAWQASEGFEAKSKVSSLTFKSKSLVVVQLKLQADRYQKKL